jgi:hypothetical protein
MYLSTERDLTDPHHPSINEIRKLLMKVEAQGITNDAFLDFYDRKFIKRTVDAAILWRGVIEELKVSEKPGLEVLSKVNQSLKIAGHVKRYDGSRACKGRGVNYRRETHMLNYVFMFTACANNRNSRAESSATLS